MSYEDDPSINLKYLKSLSKGELAAYVQGYVMACVHMREALSRGKLDILNVLLDEEEISTKIGLRRAIKLLDAYENLIKLKEANLSLDFPEFLGKSQTSSV